MLFFSTHPTNQVQMCEDDRLAVQAQRNPVVFGQLYERHADRIYRYCLVRIANVEDAQDITADIFLAALESLPRYDSRRSFIGWLYGIAHHKVVDHLRRHRPTISIELAENIADSTDDTEDLAFLRLEMQTVTRAIAALGHEQAEALSLRIFAGLSAAEIGEIMGKSEAAVKMLVHRAVSSLQKRLASEPEVTQ